MSCTLSSDTGTAPVGSTPLSQLPPPRRGQFKAAASHDIGDHYSSKGRAVVLGDMTGPGLRQCGGGNLRLVEPVFQSFKFVVPITGDELDCPGNSIEVIGQERP